MTQCAAAAPLPFRRVVDSRMQALALFNRRAEILWFGFHGSFESHDAAIRLTRLPDGMLGGGGAAALNGGVIAAGFDAAVVLTGLGHYDTDTVVTLNLAVQFLNLVAPGTKYGDRLNGVDLRFGKNFRYGRTRTLLALDVFNVTNSNTPDAYLQSYGPTYLDPVSVTRARLFKVSAQFDF